MRLFTYFVDKLALQEKFKIHLAAEMSKNGSMTFYYYIDAATPEDIIKIQEYGKIVKQQCDSTPSLDYKILLPK